MLRLVYPLLALGILFYVAANVPAELTKQYRRPLLLAAGCIFAAVALLGMISLAFNFYEGIQ